MMSATSVPIIPPPDLRSIVDKTATFVARNGPEFESRIQQNEQNNPKFNFLKPGDPYNSYYQFKVREIREGSTSQSINATTNGDSTNNKSSTAEQSTNQLQSKLIKSFAEKVKIIPTEPPPEYEFMIEPPSVLAQDLDVIKLTAQFVAIHGRSFLTNLMNKEQRNYQFDFLRPQHGLFSYFTQLIEQYTKIINQGKEILDELYKELEPDVVWKKINYRLEWTKIKEAEQQKEQEEIEKERVQYAQIDWHEFVVVETVDYQLNEQGIFPPPTTPEQVGSRILMQQRLEEEQDKLTVDSTEMEVAGEILEDAEKSVRMEELNGEDVQKPDKEAMPPPSSLPTNLNNVIIRKDYDPRQSKKQATTNNLKADAWVISPITKEKIPAEKMAEHMRYGMLDSRWLEQREKALQEKLQQEEVFAPGVAIESSLKQMAERRTDIFGAGIDETEIGKKIGEQENKDKTKDKVTWDGYSNTMEAAARAARANITIEDQIQQIHKIKGLVEEDNKDKIGPAIVPPIISPIMPPANTKQRMFMPQQSIHPPVSSAPLHHPNLMAPPPGHNMPHLNPSMMNHPPPMNNSILAGLYPPMMNHPPLHHPNLNLMPPQAPGQQNLPPPPFIPAPPLTAPNDSSNNNDSNEPATKKQRTEANLIPEEEFLASHSGSLTLKVNIPNVADKPELNLNGQTLTIKLNLTDMISVIKAKINEQLGLAPGKQKLQYEGIFIKDSNTLAYYNMLEGSIIQLALKERGGKKK